LKHTKLIVDYLVKDVVNLQHHIESRAMEAKMSNLHSGTSSKTKTINIYSLILADFRDSSNKTEERYLII